MLRVSRVLFTLLPIAIVIGGVFLLVAWSQHPGQFPLRVIEINSELKKVDPVDVTSIVSPFIEKGFFNFDVEAVQKELSNLPWVEQVTVTKLWPDKVQVSIKEQIAQALFGDNGVLSTNARIFYPKINTIPSGSSLPHFFGPAERVRDMLAQYFVLLENVAPLGFSISELHLSADGSYSARLHNGIMIILGKTALNEKMARLVLAYQKIEDYQKSQINQSKKAAIDYLDLRYTNGMAIGWKDLEPKDLETKG